MEHFYKDICKPEKSMFSFPNLYKKAVENCRVGGTIVELGSWIGQSLAYLAVEAINSKKNIKIISVDAFIGNVHRGDSVTEYPQWDVFRKNLAPVWKDLVVIKSLSHLGSEYFKAESLDFVFIDADHSLEAVRNDIKAWWPKIVSTGVMAGHDFKHPPVKQAVEEFCSEWRTLDGKNLTYTSGENCWSIIKGPARKIGTR